MGTRFKDLATEATTFATDDFFAIDGATNGSRKVAPYTLGDGAARAKDVRAFTDCSGPMANGSVDGGWKFYSWGSYASGAGMYDSTGRYGVLQGTLANGTGSGLYAFGPRVGAGPITFEGTMMLDYASDGTHKIILQAGICDLSYPAGNLPSKCALFRHVYDENSNLLQCITGNAYTYTYANTGWGVSANTWYKLGVEVNAAGNQVKFYRNGSLVSTMTTNLPTGAVGCFMEAHKTTVDGKNVYFDWAFMQQTLTNARS